jgi:hypothetical protein
VTTDWKAEAPTTALAGRVTYRCAACHELITDAEPVIADAAYHPGHAPKEKEPEDGR